MYQNVKLCHIDHNCTQVYFRYLETFYRCYSLLSYFIIFSITFLFGGLQLKKKMKIGFLSCCTQDRISWCFSLAPQKTTQKCLLCKSSVSFIFIRPYLIKTIMPPAKTCSKMALLLVWDQAFITHVTRERIPNSIYSNVREQ